jgi:diguanylate cyclase (GGDEF)-like protein/PAS domain S-box-containing protein
LAIITELRCGSAVGDHLDEWFMSLIAIIDDRISNRNIFAQLARSIEPGITVETFGDPTEALQWLASHTPDLIITDYKMPQMDATGFIRQFRKLSSSADIPVIVITIFEERSFRLQALEAGATDFLNSPVDHHEFRTRARNLLNLRKHQLLLANRANVLQRELEHSERSRELALRDSRERLAQVIDTLPVMISATGYDGQILFVNAYETALFGVDAANVVGAKSDVLIGKEAAARSFALDRMVFETGKALPTYEEEMLDKYGEKRVFLSTKAPLKDHADNVTGVLTTSLDITARKRTEAHLRHLAHHDALTDLPNRTMLGEKISAMVERARRGSSNFAVHLIDLDRFKSVNDLFGRAGGNRFLVALSEHLQASLTDAEIIARIGADEFAIVQGNVRDTKSAEAFAQQILAAIQAYVDAEDQRLTTTASIGIAVYPSDGSDPEELLKNADLAVYKSKDKGGNIACFYAADLQMQARQGAILDKELRKAIAQDQFVLYYQPQVDLATGLIVGAEALLRWRRAGVGIVGPNAFLPRAEENGLILPISEWVLREACMTAKSWQCEGLPPLRVSVNISPTQFRRRTLPLLVAKTLAETGLDPRRLDLELTESIVMHDFDEVSEDVQHLLRLGVQLAIDDFGTGYSSLGYIKRFPINRLKIDQSFVRDMAEDKNDAAIVRAIITLGHSMNITVVAEGVETADQLARLRAEGCDEVQGYYFGRPMPSEEFIELARREPTLAKIA